MENGIVYVANIETIEEENQLKTRLENMIGVEKVDIDSKVGEIKVLFETPANLNSIEKEVYDSGFRVRYQSNVQFTYIQHIYRFVNNFLKFNN